MTRTIWRAALLCLLLAAPPALAAGFYFGENGSKALLQGGAFAGQADDLTAIQHNPAGLAQQQGFSFLLDTEFLRHDVSFLRKDPGGVLFSATNEVSNTHTPLGESAPIPESPYGPFLLPNLGLGYGTLVGGRKMTVAFGVYGPPSVGKYGFPHPNYTEDATARYVENPRKFSAQRYALIDNNVIILYPSLAAAYELTPMISVGASLQYVYSALKFRQAVYSGVFEPKRQVDEDPIFDSIVSVDLQGKPSLTGILGVMVKPVQRLSVGLSVRPPVPVRASGKFAIDLGKAASGLGTTVTGDQADFELNLPLEAKLGLHYQATDALGLNADLVYQGWDSVKELLLTPRGISIQIGSAEPTEVAPFHIPKNWHSSWSGRLGGSYAFHALTVRAGLLLEQGASPDEYTNIDFAHFDRLFLTGGVGYQLSHYEVLLGGAWSPVVTKEVIQSEVRAGSTDASIPGSVVGNGTYKSGGWIATLGIRASFGQAQ